MIIFALFRINLNKMKAECYIIDKSEVFAEGLKIILKDHPSIKGVNIIVHPDESFMQSLAASGQQALVFIDYSRLDKGLQWIKTLLENNSQIKVIAITEELPANILMNALNSGVDAHLLKCCSKEEIHESIDSVLDNKKFYCGNVIRLLDHFNKSDKLEDCEGITLSSREIEIIRLIAQGLTNKEIADKLCLSPHTVHTHRKNIMQKLGIKNTAGIVIYAVKENIINS